MMSHQLAEVSVLVPEQTELAVLAETIAIELATLDVLESIADDVEASLAQLIHAVSVLAVPASASMAPHSVVAELVLQDHRLVLLRLRAIPCVRSDSAEEVSQLEALLVVVGLSYRFRVKTGPLVLSRLLHPHERVTLVWTAVLETTGVALRSTVVCVEGCSGWLCW